jgi:hypothetical protein
MKSYPIASKQGRKDKAERLRATVMQLLKWSETQFGQYQYEQGMAYLRAYLLGDKYGMSVMERSRTFWNWWKNHWTNFDEGFVQSARDIDRPVREQIYFELHDGRILSGKIRPHKVVLEESHSIMVEDLIGAGV